MTTPNEHLRRLVSIALCATFALALTVQGGLRQMVHVLGVLGLVAIVRQGRAPRSPEDRRLFFAILFFVLSAALSFAAHPSRYGASRLGLHATLLLIPAIAAGVRAARPEPGWLHGGISAGAIGAGLHAAYEALHPSALQLDAIYARAGTGYHTYLGVGAAVFAFLSLQGLVWFSSKNRLGALIPLTACVAALFCAVASASRGGWLAIAVVGSIGAFQFVPSMTWRGRVITAGSAAALVLAAALVPSFGVGARMRSMASDLATWSDHRASFSSLGGRFAAWQVALGAFVEHPVLGIGVGNYRAEAERVLGKAVAGENYAAALEHPHSEYLAALGTRGLVGFAALVTLLFVVLGRFARAARGRDPLLRIYGAAGFSGVACLAVWGLSDAMIEGLFPSGLLVAVVGVMHGMLRAREDELGGATAVSGQDVLRRI